MSIRSRILEVVVELAEVQQLRVTVSESFKGALLTGACAFAGGLVGGPIGLGVGGVVGSCVASYRGQGKYKPLAEVIMYDMTEEQRQHLATKVQRALENIRKEDVIFLLPLLMKNASLQTVVLNEVKSFVLQELGMKLL